jgi:hypothetical protein
MSQNAPYLKEIGLFMMSFRKLSGVLGKALYNPDFPKFPTSKISAC